jgi:hypothetical protein
MFAAVQFFSMPLKSFVLLVQNLEKLALKRCSRCEEMAKFNVKKCYNIEKLIINCKV